MKQQTGSSLIEVMVGLLVTAIGLLGILTMQTTALQLNQNAHLYSQATILANDILEAIKTTPADNLDIYETAYADAAPNLTGSNCENTTACTAQAIVNWNLAGWKNNVDQLLPGGQGAIDVNGQLVEISIRFNLGNRVNDAGVMVQDQDVVQIATEIGG